VEVKMRQALVTTAVRHALRCVQVQAEERAAIVLQKYWRYGQADIDMARHVIGCHLTQEARV